MGIWSCNHLHLADPQWSPDIDGMANVRIDQLSVREADNTVLAATHGRGLYTASWVSNPWVSIAENPELPVSRVWPNPVRAQLTIELETIADEQLSITLSDLQGRLVMEDVLKGGSLYYTIQTNDLAGGNYILTLHDGKRSYSQKIVKQ